jgi:peptidyl-prolyl cis-trans isomerase A (cyclophilin A)
MKKNLFLYLLVGLLFGIFICARPVNAQNTTNNPKVTMETSMGKLVIELFPKEAPETTKNFLGYVQDRYYDGTIFHRVIAGFMIQGGGFTESMGKKDTRGPIKNEAANGLKNDRGTIAMARTSDPDSATAQFFINLVNNEGLNRPKPDGYGYAVFGKVIEGMEVVDRIAKVQTGVKGPFRDVPETTVTIKSVKVEK